MSKWLVILLFATLIAIPILGFVNPVHANAVASTVEAATASVNPAQSATGEYLVVFEVNPLGAGSTTPSDNATYAAGSSISIMATASSGYAFSGWSVSDPAAITIADLSAASTTATINDAGTITANFNPTTVTPATTQTTVTCDPGSVAVGDSTSCTATVTGGSSVSGQTVSWGSAGTAIFDSTDCTLDGNGACSVTYTPSEVGDGTHMITANYVGDAHHADSSGSFTLTVTPGMLTTTTTTISPTGTASGVATVWTDLPDYSPGDTPTIYGSGFLANANITVTVARPDGTENTWFVGSDESGSFTTTYATDLFAGTFTVTATDGSNTATTTFTDKVYVSYVLEGLTVSPSVTMTQTNVLGWVEGQWVPFRLTITNTGPATTVSITEQLDYNKAADHGIDAFASCFIISSSPYCGSGATPPPGSGTVWKVLVGTTETTPDSVTTTLAGSTTVIQWTLYSVSLLAGSDSNPSTVEVKWAVHLAMGGSANLACTSGPLSPCTPITIPSGKGANQFTTDNSIIGVAGPTPSEKVSIKSVGAVATGTLSGKKLVDANGDGTLQAGETTGVGSVPINLYNSPKGVNPIDTTTTLADGSYTLSIAAGTYVVCEVVPPGYISTTPQVETAGNEACATVTVTAGETTTQDFGNFKTFTISGLKFEDKNGDGVKDPGDNGLSGWTIRLYQVNVVGFVTATTSDGSVTPLGTYSFSGLGPGSYTVCEVFPTPATDWYQTFPTPGADCTAVDTGLGPQGYSIAGTSGTDVPNQDFGNFKYGKISGMKFNDVTGNGLKDGGDNGLSGWTIHLYQKDVAGFGGTTTAADGTYSFTGLLAGDYKVCEVIQAGYGETYPTSTTDGSAACSGDGEALWGWSITVISGTDEKNKDFGNFKFFSAVTDSSLCKFDVDTSITAPGQQFKLIFIQDPSSASVYRLVASNPGQFYYNVFLIGTTATITIPYPFITQGAVPIHVYSGFSISQGGCFVPGTDVTSSYAITPTTTVTLGSYGGDPTIGTPTSFTVTGPSGFVYVAIHLDYGLKQTTGWSKGAPTPTTPLPASNDAYCYTLVTSKFPLCTVSGLEIADLGSYAFTASSSPPSQVVQNENTFKKDPGFAGIVLDKTGTPVQGVSVQIYDPKGKLLATVTTDETGFYSYQYKYTGSPATFTIKLPAYKLSQSVTVQSNKLVEVDFKLS